MTRTIFKNSSLKNVDFTETDLTKSLMINCDLTDTIFDRTVLKEADLSSALNFIIDPELNNIRKAKFSVQGLAGLLVKYGIEVE